MKDIKQLPDLKKDPRKGSLLSNGLAVSVCENDEFKEIFCPPLAPSHHHQKNVSGWKENTISA